MRYKIDRIKSAFEIMVLLAVDFLSVIVLYWLSALVRTDVLPHIYRGFPQEFPFKGFFQTAWIYVVWIFFTYYEGLYNRMLSFWDELRGLWRVSFFFYHRNLHPCINQQIEIGCVKDYHYTYGCHFACLVSASQNVSEENSEKTGFFEEKSAHFGGW